ncbi:MAG: hypothetical protein ABSE90_11345 [Verrucomicrobiota bacterium]|jgi:outer membrane murein-binding lipoprotein Lpp
MNALDLLRPMNHNTRMGSGTLTRSIGSLIPGTCRLSRDVEELWRNVEALTRDVEILTANVNGLTGDVDALTFNVDALTFDVDALTFDVFGWKSSCKMLVSSNLQRNCQK